MQKPRDMRKHCIASFLSRFVLGLLYFLTAAAASKHSRTEKGLAQHARNKIVLSHEALILKTVQLRTAHKGTSSVQAKKGEKL